MVEVSREELAKTLKSQPPNEFFEEVGRLCAAWAFLENQIEGLIWGMLGIDERLGKHITYDLDARRRWQLLLELSKEKEHAQIRDKVKTLNKFIGPLTAKRNTVVHGLIRAKVGDPRFYWVMYKGKKSGLHTEASVEGVVKVREEVQKFAKSVAELAGLYGRGIIDRNNYV